ncbi:hypothetical protein BBJ28_00018757 [Nothophytophthora sp. Chile5]|nr:hypothetical protein BBJ28_00018757 [Nothophytophthora sp. Chile5]
MMLVGRGPVAALASGCVASRRWFAAAPKAKAVNRVRGTRDLLADDAEQHQAVLDVLQRTVARYGFRQIQTPLLEYTDLFSRSLGDGSDIVMKVIAMAADALDVLGIKDKVVLELNSLGDNERYRSSADYYSHTVFEFVEKPAPIEGEADESTGGGIAVLAGGCYDGLAEHSVSAAERYGSSHAVILGGAEMENGCVKVKNLEKRQEEEVAMANLDTFEFL